MKNLPKKRNGNKERQEKKDKGSKIQTTTLKGFRSNLYNSTIQR